MINRDRGRGKSTREVLERENNTVYRQDRTQKGL